MAVFLGLDCGGSSCRALALDELGETVFQGQSGPANILSTPASVLRGNLCKAAGGCPEPVSVCGCFAGLVGDEERAIGEGMLREIFPEAQVRALPDYCAAYVASPEGTDICVIAGTGSVICSRVGGRWVKTGARGYLLGNPGSAYHYGRAALIGYLDDPDRYGEKASRLIEDTFGCINEPGIIAALYKSHSPAALLAKLAPILAEAVKDGDPDALHCMNRQIQGLARQALEHLDRYHAKAKSAVISLAGGVWDLGAPFAGAFSRTLAEAMPDRDSSTVRPKRPPAYGAARLAMELAG